MLRMPHSCALSLSASSLVSSVSLFCLVYLSLGAIRWPSELLSSILRLLLDLDTLIFFVCFLHFERRLQILLLQNEV